MNKIAAPGFFMKKEITLIVNVKMGNNLVQLIILPYKRVGTKLHIIKKRNEKTKSELIPFLKKITLGNFEYRNKLIGNPNLNA
jgi:hypothetical protein